MSDLSAKSFSTSCASISARLCWWLAGALLLLAGSAAGKKPTTSEELFNPLLGVDYAHWLVGPISHMASEEEINAYLRLASDPEAVQFIAKFWEKRNANTAVFKKTPQEIFNARVVEVNTRFAEAAFPGDRTDRGTIFILYGEPEKIAYESPQKIGDPTLEVWTYPKDAPKGLDGEVPKRLYRFFKDGELTVFFTGRTRPDPRQKLRPPNFE